MVEPRLLPKVFRFIAAAALAGWFLLTTAGDSAERSAAVDEPLHLAGGWTYWSLGDYRTHPSNGVLVQRWLTLPFLVSMPQLPSTDDPEFRKPSYLSMRFALDFVFHAGNDPDRLLAAARAMNAALGLLLAMTTAMASRWIFPGTSGLLAFALACLCPNLVAHAGLATSDVGAAFGFLLATFCWARLLDRFTIGRLLASVTVGGLLAGLKMSAPLIAFIYAATGARLVLRRRGWRWRFAAIAGVFRSRSLRLAMLLAVVVLHAVGAATILWASYGFRYSAFARFEPGTDDFEVPRDQVVMGLNRSGAAIQFAREHQLLPEAYLYGLAHTLKHAQERPSYLNGFQSQTGWWYYFPAVFLMKTPLPTIALLVLSLAGALQRLVESGSRRARAATTRAAGRALPFAALIVIYAAAACASHLNIGYRHLLPILPPLFALAGGVELARPPARIMACLLVAWLAAENAAARPHYLSYFNETAGGRTQGYRRLADSNVDWGQDLPTFARWLKALRQSGDASPVFFSYFGVDEPARFGIDAPPPFVRRTATLSGRYCFGATVFTAPNKPRPLWGDAEEQRYRALQISGPADEEQALQRLELMELRLIAGLNGRRPDRVLGGSILIFRLDSSDVVRLLDGPAPLVPHGRGTK